MKLSNVAPGPTIDSSPRNDGQRDWNPDIQDVKDINGDQVVEVKNQLEQVLDKFKALMELKFDNTHQYSQIVSAVEVLQMLLKEIDVEFPALTVGNNTTPAKNMDPTNQ